ncbi:hypothetical protein CU044_3753 [Streptomyces sp. L-9-10]|uniref:hypothetical protein n=1 Tax=Streptomyces sp. L-9-10 TaxID=1478131 RepID=UPI00101DE43A|nr:hypothetical protein [Streptomyces sp. L-9-10]RYJ26460.1 hypothetical protein CU044_3753 [Streptomyces sp. L-9-10]
MTHAENYGGDDYVGRPWLYADTADDALRRLCRVIDLPAEGWERPEHAYRVIGHLISAVQRVPEVLTCTDYLIAQESEGAITVPGADDPKAELLALYDEIRTAQAAAREATAALGRVHARLGRLKYGVSENPLAPAEG